MNNYFCVLPFYSVEIAHNNPKNIYCCRLPKSTDIKQVQQSMINQQRSPACNTCWRLEDRSLPSERQIHNATFDFYLDRDLEKIEQDAIDQLNQPQIIKLSTSNLCNGTCVTCGSDASSAWSALENKSIKYNKISIEDIEKINWADIKQLSFVGGEPLLEKLNFEVLQRLIETNNTNCFISIVTNGSCALTATQFQMLGKFPNLNICLSIDGVGKRFEYMRYPLSVMISNVNVFYYSELIEFFNKHNLNYLCKQVEHPQYFSPSNLPDEFKQQVLDNNPQYCDQVKSFLNIGTYNTVLFKKCCDELRRQDILKNINISDYLPINFLQKSTV